MNEGYIALHRKLLDWEWYEDMNVFRLFTHALLKANHADNTWRGVEIKRGSFISTYDKLAKETGLSVKQIRVALGKLKGTGEMANEGTRQHTVFIVKNYDLYQAKGKQKAVQAANEGQTRGKRRATNNNDNNDNNENNKQNAALDISKHTDFSKERIEEFVAYRKKIKAPMTQLAADRLFKKIAESASQTNMTPDSIIELMIERNWKGFDATWINKSASPIQPIRTYSALPKAGTEQ